MSEPRKTISLPFSPDDVLNISGREMIRRQTREAFDAAWARVLNDDSLTATRAKLSVEDLRNIIRAVLGVQP